MTKIKCDMTGCKYNSSCCLSPCNGAEAICTKEDISLCIDQELQQLDCACYEDNFDKQVECNKCQINKYGGIKINKDNITFE